MQNLYCLSDRAVRVMKEPGVKARMMFVLGINDTRTIDKHIRNNFPNGPLMNFNVREILKEYSYNLSDKELYRKLTSKDIEVLRNKREEMQTQNAKYNNPNKFS